MRNPFRRQTETVAPSLRDRAEALREALSRRDAVLGAAVAATVPLPVMATPVERADLYDRLLTLYAEDHNARPARDNPETERAAELVASRLWETARAVADLPAPKTLDGLRTTALAAAIIHEFALCGGKDMNDCAAVGLIRATLAVTGTPLPPGFVGFGDEPDFREREQASMDQRYSAVPAWAVAEIEAEDAANA
ncbi:hypothetical protein [Methylobacterium sp. J-067]|uniref:hypothetical protein n=1 Tax=Methylobacterium sp. J-067 TaxID=2836648 RepID=UPI001FB9F698|nr:hypothetical protein [Methylobacterium sp. J-067]MCJ2024726.1 hypothetical protein [Methylobacterium sp. J-067]